MGGPGPHRPRLARARPRARWLRCGRPALLLRPGPGRRPDDGCSPPAPGAGAVQGGGRRRCSGVSWGSLRCGWCAALVLGAGRLSEVSGSGARRRVVVQPERRRGAAGRAAAAEGRRARGRWSSWRLKVPRALAARVLLAASEAGLPPHDWVRAALGAAADAAVLRWPGWAWARPGAPFWRPGGEGGAPAGVTAGGERVAVLAVLPDLRPDCYAVGESWYAGLAGVLYLVDLGGVGVGGPLVEGAQPAVVRGVVLRAADVVVGRSWVEASDPRMAGVDPPGAPGEVLGWRRAAWRPGEAPGNRPRGGPGGAGPAAGGAGGGGESAGGTGGAGEVLGPGSV